MKIKTRLVDFDEAAILEKRGLQKGGPAQKFLEKEFIDRCEPYTLKYKGALISSAHQFPAPGSGFVKWEGPYAHYQWMGEVYGPNIPIRDESGNIEGWWSPPTKYPTGKPLDYSSSQEKNGPLAGSHWPERMMAAEGGQLLADVADFAGGKPKKG